MVKVLSRDAVQRMTGRRSSSAVNIGGGSGDPSGVSRAWVDENYISKNFFNQLFTIHGTRTYIDEETEQEVTEEVVITPNTIPDGEEYKLSNVEVSVGLWTKQFLSALGLNPGGGGGGGATALTELVDVNISNPQNGQALVYNSTAGKWINGNVTPDLSDYATKQWVQQGYLPLTGGTMANTNLVTNLNADLLDGYHVKGTERGLNGNILYKNHKKIIVPAGGGYVAVAKNSGVPFMFGYFMDADVNPAGAVVSINCYSWSSYIQINVHRSTGYSNTMISDIIVTNGTNGSFNVYLKVNNNTQATIEILSEIDISGDVEDTVTPIESLNLSGTWGFASNYGFKGNASTATKLQTHRTIFGQIFDGTGNVSGAITEVTTISASSNVSVGGTLDVTGTTTLSGTLGVSGLLTANGGITIPSGKTLTISNTNLVTNLNADMLDGRHGDGYVTIETEQTVSGNKTFSGTITPTGGIVPRAMGSVNTHDAADNSKLVIKQASEAVDETPNNGLVFEWGTSGNWVGQLYFGDNGTQGLYWGGWKYQDNVLTRNEWVKLAFVTDNVASATKLQTARTIWGQNFDGTGNVSGDITDAGNIFAKGDYLLLSSGKSKYGLMVESTSWGDNRDCAFGFHAATSGHDIAWSTRSGSNDICLDLVIDTTNTVAKRYTRVYDALRIGDGMIVWDSANNALKVIKINGDAANFYATGGVSALGYSS